MTSSGAQRVNRGNAPRSATRPHTRAWRKRRWWWRITISAFIISAVPLILGDQTVMQTNDIEANPFAILSFIIAPAILTNASSVLAMTTSNRLARAVDRARELTKQLEEYVEAGSAVTNRRLRELAASETRALMLIRALRSFYAALGAFASAALLSLLGAVVVSARADLMVPILEAIGVVAGVFAVGALVHGSVLLVHETRIAVKVLSDRAAEVRSRLT